VTSKSKNSGTRKENLKAKNAVYLWSFIGVNLAMFWSLLVNKQFTGASIEHFWSHIVAKDGIIAVCIPIVTIVLTGALDDTSKARLVFWRWRDPLPGCRAFTELVKTDPRIDVPALKEKHGELPRRAPAQNALWYRLYRTHTGCLQVSEGHRLYLLTRDMATLAATFISLFPIGILLASINRRLLLAYIAALLLQFVVVATAARNYGTRFVLNVLAEESHT
jgi:hypothetical protein